MNAKIQITALALLMSVLAGCSRDEKAEDNTDTTPWTEDAEVTPKQPESTLAEGIKLSFDHNVRQDRVREVKPGDYQRRVWVEYINLDQQQAVAAITADATTAGYALVESDEMEEGAIRLRFKPEKGPRISATVREGGDLQHPSARGTVQFNIPVKAPTE